MATRSFGGKRPRANQRPGIVIFVKQLKGVDREPGPALSIADLPVFRLRGKLRSHESSCILLLPCHLLCFRWSQGLDYDAAGKKPCEIFPLELQGGLMGSVGRVG
jgi:hypothetical protein